MTNPLSQIQRTIALLYKMQSDDIDKLEDELLDAAKRAWRTALEEKARAYGCRKPANDPRMGDLSELRRQAREDAQSISDTWNRDVEIQIRRVAENNPRANRYEYYSTLEQWAERRSVWKNRQISVTTEQRARAYAQDRFRQENGLRGKLYTYVGPPPVSDICQRRMSWGRVTEDIVQSNPTPAHPGPCVHEWVEVIDEQLVCSELWVG